MVAMVGVPMHLRHEGVDLIIGYPIAEVNEARRGASMTFFDTSQRHAAVVGRYVH